MMTSLSSRALFLLLLAASFCVFGQESNVPPMLEACQSVLQDDKPCLAQTKEENGKEENGDDEKGERALASDTQTQDTQTQDKDTPSYTDNYLGEQTSNAWEGFSEEDTRGRLKRVSVDVFFGQSQFNDHKNTEQGARVQGSVLTDDWGVFSFEAMGSKLETPNTSSFRSNVQSGTNIRGTVWQRDFYLTNNIVMNNTLGVTQTIPNNVMTDQQRFYFPTLSMLGVKLEGSTNKQNSMVASSTNIQGVTIGLAQGKTGRFTGGRFPGFDTTDGRVQQVSAFGKTNDWVWGGNVLRTEGGVFDRNFLSAPYLASEFPIRSTSIYGGVGQHHDTWSVKLNTLQSTGVFVQNDIEETRKGQGMWLEGDYTPSTQSSWSYSGGVFSFSDDLLWGSFPVISNTQGGFARANFKKPRMQFGVGVDRIMPKKGEGFDGLYASSYMRFQKDPLVAYGGALSARDHKRGQAYSLQVYTDRRNRWGQMRLSGEYASQEDGNGVLEDTREDSWQGSVEQSWQGKGDSQWSLMTSVGKWSGEQVASVGGSTSFSLGEKTKLQAVARLYHNEGTQEKSQGHDISVSLDHAFSKGWSSSVSFNQSRGYVRTPFNLDPLFQEDVYSRYRDKSLFVSMRYDFQKGRVNPILAKNPLVGGGAGHIEGIVFLDENRDGVKQATEEVAQNVQVVLNGVFVTQTNEQGAYRFERVITGNHTLMIVPDNLPLPWQADKVKQIQVDVRQTTQAHLPAWR